MSVTPSSSEFRRRLTPMLGRDPQEGERASTPLELLFDLIFVVAVGTSAAHFAEMAAEGHVAKGVVAFVFAMFAICVAWISFTWFASSFDTDDWLYRILTMLTMVGVVIFALGLAPMFHSIDEGHHVDTRIMVIGYVVMRVPLVAQWWRASRQSSDYRRVALRNIRWLMIVQAGWVVFGFVPMPLVLTAVIVVFLGACELLIPVLAQGGANGTPWHPHHIAERYSLLAIITLGEGIVGTIGSSQGLLGGEAGDQWSWNAIAVVITGIGLTFGMWWVYFMMPFGTLLQHRPTYGYFFGYGHVLVFMAIAGAGAGLHILGLFLEHESELGEGTAVAMLAVPVAIYLAGIYSLHDVFIGRLHRLHLVNAAITVVLLAAAIVLAAVGAPISISLLLIMAAPFVTIVAYEAGAYRWQEAHLERLAAGS
ncbi:MAG TPA: low temperature requirement protein A [Flexivirga sp.]|uniref:low temperature requirement protein A n=1 Tax=Flexivirga sp. TaxID=1962927 RepID=UPI002CF9E74D|nr:low temperature requirement protein A [Flexivirga sp.]HWC21227.1 low temperature requirement protein A [Flexivirga sp.]